MICGLTSARSANTSAITSPPKSDMPFLWGNEEESVNNSDLLLHRLTEPLQVGQSHASAQPSFILASEHQPAACCLMSE